MRLYSRVIGGAILLAVAADHAAAQGTYYVRTSGSDSSDGLTPATALRTIQSAVGKCTKNGGKYTIIVGPGTYTERVRITSTVVPTPVNGTAANVNCIFGDSSGSLTGDPGGSVIVSGGGTHPYGVEVSGRNYWDISGLTFANQTMAGVTLSTGAGLYVRNCKFLPGSTASYAIYSDASHVTIAQNVVEFAREGGHGFYLRCIYAGSYTVERNVIWMAGDGYLSTGYATNPSMPAAYGIYAKVESDLSLMSVLITNNIVTDRNFGIYVDADTIVPTTVTVSSNTVTGCTVPIYQSVYGGSVGLALNNIVAESYQAGKFDMPLGTLSGLLTWKTPMGLLSSVLTQTAVILEQDPMFVAPSAGNFRLSAGSPAIDTGILTSAPLNDLSGRARPADGNADALALPDLGAFEYASTSGMRITAWNQKDQRSVPRYKLPTIAPLKVGSVLIP